MTLMDRIEANCIPEPNSGCWLWTGYLTTKGYATMSVNNHPARVARLVKPITRQALHRCDVRCCVNPDHIYDGNAQDNRDDAVRRGRQARGAKHGGARLNAADAAAIRKSPEHWTVIAARYGIKRATVYAIRSGRLWRM